MKVGALAYQVGGDPDGNADEAPSVSNGDASVAGRSKEFLRLRNRDTSVGVQDPLGLGGGSIVGTKSIPLQFASGKLRQCFRAQSQFINPYSSTWEPLKVIVPMD